MRGIKMRPQAFITIANPRQQRLNRRFQHRLMHQQISALRKPGQIRKIGRIAAKHDMRARSFKRQRKRIQ